MSLWRGTVCSNCQKERECAEAKRMFMNGSIVCGCSECVPKPQTIADRVQAMTDEYIARGTLLAAYDREHKGEPGRARELIANAPAEDVQPVRHGRWIEFETDAPPRRNECSECGYITNPWLAHVYSYCPNCGAKMDKEAQDG